MGGINLNKVGNKKTQSTASPINLNKVVPKSEVKEKLSSSNISAVSTPGVDTTEYERFFDEGRVFVNQDLDRARAERQSAWEQARRSIGKGVAKGVLTFTENIGYLTDIETMVSGIETLEDAQSNWLSSLSKQGKKALDEALPIHRTNPNKTWDFSDSGWVFQQLEGLVDSGVGFGLTGFGAGAIVGRGAAALSNMVKLGLVEEQLIATLGTAMATNYAESRMMSLDLYKDVYDTAIKAGKTEDEAETLAAKEANDFVWQNKIGIITDAITINSIFKGNQFTRGADDVIQRSLKNRLKGFGLEAVTESFEEVSAGFLQKDNLRDAKQSLGLELEDEDDSYLKRALVYSVSDEGLLEATLGAIGGPFQKILGKGAKAATEKATGRSTSFGANTDISGWNEEVLKTLSEIENSTREQADAFIKGDIEKVKQLDNENYESIAGKYFGAKRGESLERLLQETANDESLPAEQQQKAKERLAELPSLEAKYRKIYNKNGRNKGLTDLVWKTDIQKNSVAEYINNTDKELLAVKNDLVSNIQSLTSKVVDPVQLEQTEVKQQVVELAKAIKYLENSNYGVNNTAVIKRLNSVLTDMDSRVKELEEVLKTSKIKIPESTLKGIQAYKEIKDLVKKRIDGRVAYNVLEETYQKLIDPAFKERRQESVYNQAKEDIGSLSTQEDAVDFQEGIKDSILEDKEKNELLDLVEKRKETILNNIVAEKTKAVTEKVKKNKKAEIVANTKKKALPTEQDIQKEVLQDETKDSESKTVIVETDKKAKKQYEPTIGDVSPSADQSKPITEDNRERAERPGVAWISYTDAADNESGKDFNQVESNLTLFVEDPTIDKTGTKLLFEADASLDTLKDIVATSDEAMIETLPIKIFVLNEDNTKKVLEGKELFGYVSEQRIPIDTRKELIKLLSEGKTVMSNITSVGPGKRHFGEQENNPLSLFGEGTVYIGSHSGLVTGAFNNEPQTDGKFKSAKPKIGRAYFANKNTRAANSAEQPIVLNSSKINEQQAETILAILDLYSEGFKPKDSRIVTNNLLAPLGIEGLTPSQVLDLLIYKGEHSKNFPFNVKMSKGKVEVTAKFLTKGQFIENTLDYNEIKDTPKRAELLNYLKTVPRSTEVTHINKNLNDESIDNRIVDDFVWFGKPIKADSSYNDFLFNDGALTTNIKQYRNSVIAVNPWIDYNENPADWIINGATSEVQDIPSDKIIDEKQLSAEDIEFLKETSTLNDDAESELKEQVESTAKDSSPKKKQDTPPPADEGFSLEDPLFHYNTGELVNNGAQELERFKKDLPNVPVEVVEGLIKYNGVTADGMLYNNVVSLSDIGTKGRAWHEAFHAVTQMFLTDSERAKLYKDTYPGLDTLNAEEALAEDYRAYRLDEETKPLLKRLFDSITEFINYVLGDTKTKLFRDIRKGRYAYSPSYNTTNKLFDRLGLHPTVQKDMVESFSMMAMKHSGQLGDERQVFNSWNTVEDFLQYTAGQLWRAHLDKGNTEVAKNFEIVYNQWPIFRVGLMDYLNSLNLLPNKDATETAEEEASEGLNIKNALEYSGKQNASGLTKMLVSTLVDRTDVSPHTRLPRLAPFAQSWRVLENTLSNIVTDTPTDVKKDPENLFAKMKNKIKELSQDNPHFMDLHSKLTDPAVAENTKIQFVKAFSKQSVLFSSTLYNSETGQVKIINADSNNQSSVVRSDWTNSVKETLFEGNNVIQAKKQNLITSAERLREAAPNLTRKELNETVAKLYNYVGIDVLAKDIEMYANHYNSKPHDQVLTGYGNYSLLAPIINKSKSAESAVQNITTWDPVKNPVSDYDSVFKKLSEIKAFRSKIPGENVVLGPNGNQYWTKSENNNMVKALAAYKNQPELLDNLLSKDWHKHSLFLKELRQALEDGNIDKHNVEVFLSNRVEDDSIDAGTDFKGMNPTDEIVERINRTLSGYQSPLTFADKSTWYQMSGFKVRKFNGNTKEVAKLIYDNYFLAEYGRILSPGADIKNFNKNKNKFYLFPSLNNDDSIYIDGDKNKGLDQDYVLKHIENIVQDRVDENLATLRQYDLIDQNGSIIGLAESVKNSYNAFETNYPLLLDITANSIINNTEFTMMFAGDPAFYKDLSKRTPAVIATGNDLVLMDDVKEFKEPIDRKFKVAVLSSYEIDSEFITDYQRKIEQDFKKTMPTNEAETKAADLVNAYRGLEEGDAQAYITHTRFRDIMRMSGKWEQKHEDAYNRLIAGDSVSYKDIQMMQPIKGMHFELVEQGDRMVPVYLKYSQAVLWPALVKGTKLESVLDTMTNTDVKELVFESGVKVGAQGITSSQDYINSGTLELNPLELDNFYWKMQQDLPSKLMKKRETLEGSQVKKNILANLDLENPVYDGMTGREVLKKINSLENAISDIGASNLRKRWGIENGNINNMDVVYQDLIDKFRKDQVSDNIIEALEMRVPLDSIFQFGEKIEQQLLSIINTNTIKTTMPGGALIQVSSFGFQKTDTIDRTTLSETNGIKYLKDVDYLKGPHYDSKGFKRAQVFIPHYMTVDLKTKHGLDIDNMSGAELASIFGDTLDGVIGYRIPNQGMSSIDTMEVVGILPESMGDSIVTYREVTAKTGSDFDIDKMYVMLHNLQYNKEENKLERIPYVEGETNSLDAIKNEKLRLYDTILTSEHTQPQLVTPLDSEWLKEDSYYLAVLEKLGPEKAKTYLNTERSKKADWLKSNYIAYEDLQEFNLTEQFDIKMRNIAGKAGVGQTANQLTHHPLSQHVDLGIKTDLGVGFVEEGVTELSNDVNENGDYITSVISAWLNAYVDNAKDPYISLINNNTKTANTVFMLLRMGVDPKWVNRLTMQPIVKELVQEELNRESKISRNFNASVKEEGPYVELDTEGNLVTKFPFKKGVKHRVSPIENILIKNLGPGWSEAVSAINDEDFTLEQLEKEIVNPDLTNQIKILKKFLKHRYFADKLNEVVISSKTDTQGATSSTLEANRILETRQQILDEGLIVNYDKMLESDTQLGNKTENSIDFVFENLGGELLSTTPVVTKTVNQVIEEFGIPNNDKNRKEIFKNIKSYLYSSNQFFRLSKEEKHSLYEEVPNIVLNLKENTENALGKILTVKQAVSEEETAPGFYKKQLTPYVSSLFNTVDKTEANIIWTELEEMLDNPETRTDAEKLVKYSFLNSGFQKNKNSFFEYVPSTFLNKIAFYETVRFQKEAMQGNTVLNDFITQFARNNIGKTQFYNVKDLGQYAKVLDNGIILHKEVAQETPSVFSFNKFIYRKVQEQGDNIIYQKYTTLGKNENGETSVEYDTTTSHPESAWSVNIPLIEVSEEIVKNYPQEVVITESDEYSTIENLDAKIIAIEETQTIDDVVYKGFKVTLQSDNKSFDLISDELFENKKEALEYSYNILRNLGFDLIQRTLKTPC